MPGQPKILAFAGSSRRDSLNKKLLKIAVEGARAAGGQVTELELSDYPMPIYNGDLEAGEGLPENAVKLRRIFGEHQALLIASGEYNSSVTPLLKNSLDWVSRPTKDEPALKYFTGKAAALLSTGGGLGGLRGLVHVRQILGNIGVIVLPEQLAVPAGATAFDEAGKLKVEAQQAAAANVGRRLAEVSAKLFA